jgi:hypothetical protein
MAAAKHSAAAVDWLKVLRFAELIMSVFLAGVAGLKCDLKLRRYPLAVQDRLPKLLFRRPNYEGPARSDKDSTLPVKCPLSDIIFLLCGSGGGRI